MYCHHLLAIFTLILRLLRVHVYSCFEFPGNEVSVFLYKLIPKANDTEQVNGPLPDPPHNTVVLLGPIHCPPPPPVPLLPASTQWSGLSTVRAISLITVYSGRQ